MPGTAEGIKKARESLARLRADRAARARLRRDAAGPTTFSQAFDTVFADWFAGPTWRPWRTVGKAVFGEPLSDAELEEYRQFTGRTQAPTAPAREVWLVVGRRAGKDWFSAAVVVYLVCYRTPPLKVGDLGRVMLFAVDMDQAAECYRYICELIDTVPELRAMVRGRSIKLGMLRLDLDNRIQIVVKPADKRRVRGRTVLAVVASEIAFWWDDETNANPATEVLRTLRPSRLGVPGALLLAVSSPYARKGVLWEAHQAHWGKDDDRVLIWKASTMDMRPDTSPEFLTFLEEELRADPVAFDAEYRANFRRDVEAYVNRTERRAPFRHAAQDRLAVASEGDGQRRAVVAATTRGIQKGDVPRAWRRGKRGPTWHDDGLDLLIRWTVSVALRRKRPEALA